MRIECDVRGALDSKDALGTCLFNELPRRSAPKQRACSRLTEHSYLCPRRNKPLNQRLLRPERISLVSAAPAG